jgi:2Fe-2S ferredoxin
MPKITVLPHPQLAPAGAVFDVPETTSICDALHRHGIDIEHACGQVGACSTCHVVVREGYASLSPFGDYEEDMLDQAWGLQPLSRLSCQARAGAEDLTVEIPKYSINHAKEIL